MKPAFLVLVAVAAVLGAALAGAQTAHVYHHSPPTGQITNTVLCNSACTTPVPQEAVALGGLGYPTWPLTGALNPAPLGGHALDQIDNREYVSDGPSIAVHQFHPLYSGPMPCTSVSLCGFFGGVFGPGPLGPFSYPHVFPPPGPVFGDIRGMAVRRGGLCPPVLYVTDGTYIMGLRLCPDTAAGWTLAGVNEGPFLAPPTVAGALLSGLECDFGSGVLVACDVNGFSYLIPTPCSIPMPSPPPIPPPAGPFLPGSIIGNVYDRSLGGVSLYVTNGVTLFPVLSPCGLANVPIAPLPPGQTSRGASFSAEPIVLQACSDYSDLVIGTTEPMVGGKTCFITLQAPSHPNASAALLYGACTSTPFITDCPSCVLWIDALTAGWVPATTDAAGEICLLTSIPSVPLTGYLQWVVFDVCQTGPSSWFFSDALHCRTSDP